MKDFICDDDYRPLIPDGVYEAQCVGYDTKFLFGRVRKTFLYFKIITEGEHFGTVLFMAFNMPYNGRIKTGRKYYKTWVMVNGWQKPSRNTKMSPRIFINKIYKIKTRAAKPLHNRKEMPKKFKYSVVDQILEVIAI